MSFIKRKSSPLAPEVISFISQKGPKLIQVLLWILNSSRRHIYVMVTLSQFRKKNKKRGP